MVFKTRNEEERFWEKVWKTSTCWFWIGAHDQDNYGSFRCGPPQYKRIRAHKWSYLKSGLTIPYKYQLHHTCQNPSCVNPDHLEALSAKSHRHTYNYDKTECPRGHVYDRINSKGLKYCSACSLEACHRYRNRKRQSLAAYLNNIQPSEVR